MRVACDSRPEARLSRPHASHASRTSHAFRAHRPSGSSAPRVVRVCPLLTSSARERDVRLLVPAGAGEGRTPGWSAEAEPASPPPPRPPPFTAVHGQRWETVPCLSKLGSRSEFPGSVKGDRRQAPLGSLPGGWAGVGRAWDGRGTGVARANPLSSQRRGRDGASLCARLGRAPCAPCAPCAPRGLRETPTRTRRPAQLPSRPAVAWGGGGATAASPVSWGPAGRALRCPAVCVSVGSLSRPSPSLLCGRLGSCSRPLECEGLKATHACEGTDTGAPRAHRRVPGAGRGPLPAALGCCVPVTSPVPGPDPSPAVRACSRRHRGVSLWPGLASLGRLPQDRPLALPQAALPGARASPGLPGGPGRAGPRCGPVC